MQDYIFNIHDIFLLFSILCGLFLAALQPYLSKEKNLAAYLLIGFFIIQSIHNLSILLFWNNFLRQHNPIDAKAIFAGFEISHIIQAPLIYLYIQARTTTNYRFLAGARPHLIATVLFSLVVIVDASLGISAAIEDAAMGGVEAKGYWPYWPFCLNSARYFWCIIYAGLAFMSIHRYQRRIYDRESDLNADKSLFLYLLVGGFLLIWLLRFLVALLGYAELRAISDTLGVSTNYLGFALLICLFILGLNKLEAAAPLSNKSDGTALDDEKAKIYIEKIKAAINQQHLHLESTINIERFSKASGVSARMVSLVLNKYLNCNFFEFINRYRLDEAKKMLAAPEFGSRQIIDIQLACGFNSKTAFNRFFKRSTGMSPTEYRKQQLSGNQSPAHPA